MQCDWLTFGNNSSTARNGKTELQNDAEEEEKSKQIKHKMLKKKFYV